MDQDMSLDMIFEIIKPMEVKTEEEKDAMAMELMKKYSTKAGPPL